MRVFLDANVLFTAAHNPKGKAALVIDLGRTGHFGLFTSDVARQEAERNLIAKYPATLAVLAALMERVTIARTDLHAPCPESIPAKDAVIFRAAVTCHATHLLTGDLHHFGPLMNRPESTFGILVQTVAQFLNRPA